MREEINTALLPNNLMCLSTEADIQSKNAAKTNQKAKGCCN